MKNIESYFEYKLIKIKMGQVKMLIKNSQNSTAFSLTTERAKQDD